MRVLAVDPGREKCGLAVVGRDGILHREIVPPGNLAAAAGAAAARYAPDRIVVGAGTGAAAAVQALARAGLAAGSAAERDTTLRARARYFRDHPPLGWRRLVPLSFQIPPEAYDDYAAVVIAEDLLAADPGR